MDLCIQEVYWEVLLGITAAVREQKKRLKEKLNCDAVATKVSVDLVSNSESGMSFENCPKYRQRGGPFHPCVTGSSGVA